MSNQKVESNRGVGVKPGQFGHSRTATDQATADDRAAGLDGDDGDGIDGMIDEAHERFNTLVGSTAMQVGPSHPDFAKTEADMHAVEDIYVSALRARADSDGVDLDDMIGTARSVAVEVRVSDYERNAAAADAQLAAAKKAKNKADALEALGGTGRFGWNGPSRAEAVRQVETIRDRDLQLAELHRSGRSNPSSYDIVESIDDEDWQRRLLRAPSSVVKKLGSTA